MQAVLVFLTALLKAVAGYLGLATAQAKTDRLQGEAKNEEAKISKEQEEAAVNAPRTAADINDRLHKNGL